MKILCSISTKKRYEFLPLALASVANQTRPPDQLVIFDDNDPSVDLRGFEAILKSLMLLDSKGVPWTILYGSKKGQHFNHQTANRFGYEAVWRLDDDCVAEPHVLKCLESHLQQNVGAVGGSVIVPPNILLPRPIVASSSIDELDKLNKQWFKIDRPEEVDHLHCSFLYRAGVVNYDRRLSKKAHREETMFTYSLKLKGYKILIVPCVTWHLKSQAGGIRSDDDARDYQWDEFQFQQWLKFQKTGKKLYVLDCGLGDHYMFLQALRPNPRECVIAACHPKMLPGYETISIADAMNTVDIGYYNIYEWCGERNWKGTLIEAFREMYKSL